MRVSRVLSTGSSSGRLGSILKSLGMTAARVELDWLASLLLRLSVVVDRIGGDGTALDRVSKHAGRRISCLKGRHIVLGTGRGFEGDDVAAH